MKVQLEIIALSSPWAMNGVMLSRACSKKVAVRVSLSIAASSETNERNVASTEYSVILTTSGEAGSSNSKSFLLPVKSSTDLIFVFSFLSMKEAFAEELKTLHESKATRRNVFKKSIEVRRGSKGVLRWTDG